MKPTPTIHSSPDRLHCGLCAAFTRLSAQVGAPDGPDGPAQPQRRRFGAAVLGAGAALALPAWPQQREGVDVGRQSSFSKLVPAEQVEQAAAQQYAKMMAEARAQNALVADGQPQPQRLRYMAERIIPFSPQWNPRAPGWKWEVNLLNSKQINAFCMPGGKIAFYTGLIEQLKLTDDEVSMVMGHEVAHALREHARERMGKSAATNIGIEVGAALFGLGSLSRGLAGMGAQLLSLKFSRDDESEADLVGMELAARAGYDPRSGVSLWTKMGAATGGGGGGGGNKLAEYGSTHPQGPTRIKDIEANLPRVMPLYERAPKPGQRWDGRLASADRAVSRPATPARDTSR